MTQKGTAGDHARSRLDGKLVNIASDVSAKIGDEAIMKRLISREAVSARRLHKNGHDIRDYARLIFAFNKLPPQIFSDTALTKRVVIIEFDQQIATQDMDTGFARKIIENELSGVMNWIIAGLDQLLETERLDPPQCVVESMERLRVEIDPVSAWLDEKGFSVGDSQLLVFNDGFQDFVAYCQKNRHSIPTDKTFGRRLRSFGYMVKRVNGTKGMAIYYSKTPRKPEEVSFTEEVDVFVDETVSI